MLRSLLHLGGACHELVDVEACHGNGQQTHGGEHRETAAHIVGDDERAPALFVGHGAQGTLPGVGDGHDFLVGSLFALLLLEQLTQQTEGDGRLGGSARFGNDYDAELLALQQLQQLSQVVLTDVLACKEHARLIGLLRHIGGEGVAKSLDNGFGAQV